MAVQPRYTNQEIDELLCVFSGYASEPEKCQLEKLAALLRECDLEVTRKAITECLELLARVDALLTGRPTYRNLTEARDLLFNLKKRSRASLLTTTGFEPTRQYDSEPEPELVALVYQR